MRTNIILVLMVLAFIGCKKATKVESDSGAVITCRFYNIEKNGETKEGILEKLKIRVGHLSEDAKVYYSDLDSTYQITVPNYYSERFLRLLPAKGEINMNMLWHHSEFQKPHGDRLISELSKKYKVSQQEVDFIIDDVTYTDTADIKEYINKNNLLDNFPIGTRVYWKAPSVLGREKKLVMFFLSDSPDNFNLNTATDSSEIEVFEDRYKEHYTKMFLNKEYTSIYADISDKNVGNTVVISLDDYVVSTPIIDSKVDTGVILALGDYDYEGFTVFQALLKTQPIKSPSEIVSINIISDHKSVR